MKTAGKRKRMRKAIREAMGDPRPWLEVVEDLQSKGIPLNLILSEANDFGIRKKKQAKGKIMPADKRTSRKESAP